MKARRGEIERTLDAPPGEIRLFLLHGPDAAGSNALAARLAAAMGPGAERIDLTGAALKADPARLTDEAASFSLFGGKRYILVEGGGDESVEAVAALLEAPAAGNPVAIVSAVLKKGSKLLALVDGSAHAMSMASYVPEGRDADRMVSELAHGRGLGMASDVARRIADAGNGDRTLVALELDKFALFLDVAPDRPARLDHDMVDALCAGNETGHLSQVVDAVLDGDPDALERQLGQLMASGGEGVTLVRSLSRRLLLLARLRGEMDRGNSADAVMTAAGKSLFYKDKQPVARQLGRWTSERIAAALSRILAAEEALKAPASPGALAIYEPLFAMARAGARRR